MIPAAASAVAAPNRPAFSSASLRLPESKSPRCVSKGLAAESNGRANVLLHRHLEPDVKGS